MKKLHEPNDYDTAYCPRCGTYYCAECVGLRTVDFDVVEIINEHHPNPNVERQERDWKSEGVCPWCYNQLMEVIK